MTCIDVRERLAELAVGVLPDEERAEVERHLRWCAGCRKEVAELDQAAASLALVLEPAVLPATLGERVVDRVKRAAGAPGTVRRARTVAASIVAAMVAVSSLGWGAVMAGRADRFAERAERAEQLRRDDLADFVAVMTRVVPSTRSFPEELMHLGRLTPTGAAPLGAGQVLQLVSPEMQDFTFVVVNGLDPRGAALPYRIQLLDPAGQMLRAGRIDELDADGAAEEYHQFDNADLTEFTTVRIVDANGEVVLTGEVERPGSQA